MRIQHNIMAMNAYRNYNTNTSALSKNLEKLSSGYKINRAGDDAAGLAISEKMRAQITGLNAAQKNVKDGISLVKTAEGAMQEIQDMLNRMDYLATQSANGTYDNEVDRANLQKEVNALKTEIDRIADSANFNGIKLLDGSLDSAAKDAVDAVSKDATGMLPAVGQILGKDTVLHAEKGDAPTATQFSLDFHNLAISGPKDTEFTIKVGNTTLTGKLLADAATDAPIDGAAVVAALAGTATDKISFTYADGTAYDATAAKFGEGEFSVAADPNSTTRVIFTQTNDVDFNPDMKVEIKLGDNDDLDTPEAIITVTPKKATQAGPGFTAGTATAQTAVTSNIGDVSGTTAIGATIETAIKALTGGAALDIGGVKVDLKDLEIDENTTADDAIAAIQAAVDTAVAAANKTAETAALTGKSNYDKIEDVTVATDGTTGIKIDWKKNPQTYSATGTPATASKIEVDFSDKTGADVIGQSVTIEGKTFEFVKTGDAATIDGAVAVEVGETDNAATIAGALKTKVLADTTANANLSTTPNDHTITDGKLTFVAKDTTTEITGKLATATPDKPKMSGDYNVSTTNIAKKGEAADERLASTYFDLSAAMAANGNQITIGKETYTFTTDEADKSMFTPNTDNKVYVGDLDLSTKAGLTEAAERLTNVASANATYTVGHDGKRMTFTEVDGQTQFSGADALNKYENIEKSFGFKTAAQEAVEADSSKALTLQIGDTSDDFNRLAVSIGDMHTAALGIADLDISNPESAKNAIQTIKDAINNVSSVRGDLGAVQNRLEHTANNLSVMAENIQDAESTIRDTDVAEEMMAYTKNNILIQSAQAMLAQANQVPQGVLQLLQ